MKIKFVLLFCLIALPLLSSCNNYEKIKNSKFYSDLTLDSKINLPGCIYSVPKNYDPDKAYPLIVVLHGLGENAEAFGEIWKPTTDSLDYVLLSVQGEKAISDEDHFAWGKNAESNILNAIDLIKNKINIDNSRIYIAGFSAGGSLAAYLGFKYPFQFKGTVILSTRIREEYFSKSLINQNNSIFIGSGSLEEEYSELSLLAVESLKERGVTVMRKTYEGIGHDIPKPWNKTISEILNFLNQ